MSSSRPKGKIKSTAGIVSGPERCGELSSTAKSTSDAAIRLLVLAMADAALRDHGSESRAIKRKAARHHPPSVPVDALLGIEVAVAVVMLAAALATVPDLIDQLLQEQPVVVVEVPDADWIDPVAHVARSCFASNVMSEDHRPKSILIDGAEEDRSVYGAAVVAGSATSISGVSERSVAQALTTLRPIVGIVASARSELPKDLLRACDHRVAIGPFDNELLRLIIKATTGAEPTAGLASDLLRFVEFADLRTAVNASRGADGSVDRLTTILRRRVDREADTPRLRDLQGYGAAKTWGMEVAADLSSVIRGELPGSEIDRGVVLWGPPGTGKTLFARALAREAGVPLVAGSLARWQSAGEAHLGTTLKAIRKFFADARRLSPTIALIDELDSFGNRNEFSAYNRHYSTQIVNGLLECMDGHEGREGVLLVGTTNALNRIDPAILRSGRFDRTIHVGLPSHTELVDILRHQLGHELEHVDLIETVRQAGGGTGADCSAWVRRARGRARRAGRRMSLADLQAEIGSARAASPNQDWRIAIHECGHAIVAAECGIHVKEVVLGVRSPTLAGYVMHDLGSDPVTTSFCRRLLRVAMAGRAAELLILGEISAGASDDLRKATEIAGAMIGEWGLSGLLTVHRKLDPIDGRIEQELQQAFHEAISILARHRNALEVLARRLVEKRHLDAAEVAKAISV